VSGQVLLAQLPSEHCHRLAAYHIINSSVNHICGCLFGLAVECATARLSMRTGPISWTELGTNPEWGAKIRSGEYAIGLISWAASSTVSSLICDRWLTQKLATLWSQVLNRFPGELDSAVMIDVRLRLRGWTYSEPQ